MKAERWQDAIGILKQNRTMVEKNVELLWDFGWCYFKIERMREAQKHLQKAMLLAPRRFICLFGLGSVYLKKKQYKKAEPLLSQALQIKEFHAARISLALALQGQGKVAAAEEVHLEGIRRNPNSSQQYESYAAFLSDVGRESEARKMHTRAVEVQKVN